MRKLIYHVAASADGCIAERDGSFECFMQIHGEHLDDYLASLQTYDAVLMGRSTYDVGLQVGITNPYPNLQSYVFSNSMEASRDEKVQLVRNYAPDFVRNLKERAGGPIYLCGGAQLAGTLLEAELIDELVIKLNPLLIGNGIRLFSHVQKPVYLELLDTKPYQSGVVLLSYRVGREAPARA